MRRAAPVWIAVAATLAACSGDTGTGPDPDPVQAGWLSVEVGSPDTDAGGVLFTVTGGPIDSIRGNAGLQAYARQASESSWLVLLIGRPIPNGAIGAIYVPDVARAADYRATVTQVAVNGTHQQRDPAEYVVRVVP